MICCVVLVCLLSRDFGPMLTAERKARRLLAERLVSSSESEAKEEEESKEGKETRKEQHCTDELLTGKW